MNQQSRELRRRTVGAKTTWLNKKKKSSISALSTDRCIVYIPMLVKDFTRRNYLALGLKYTTMPQKFR